jgi:hypothetical protein
MSYYPILKVPGCFGSTTLFNFAPNNWEQSDRKQRYINATWVEDKLWRSECIGTLAIDESLTISGADIMKNGLFPEQGIFLSLTNTVLPCKSQELPAIEGHPFTSAPAWRATLRLSTANATTCYQGEIDPFSSKGSLLSFGPFIQYGENVENFLVMINIEKSPFLREGVVEIIDTATMVKRGEFKILNNDSTVISIDNLGFSQSDLPLIICRNMSAIPLFLSRTKDGDHLSLEHTHPPASLVVHGNRWEIQRLLKNHWFSRVVQ